MNIYQVPETYKQTIAINMHINLARNVKSNYLQGEKEKAICFIVHPKHWDRGSQKGWGSIWGVFLSEKYYTITCLNIPNFVPVPSLLIHIFSWQKIHADILKKMLSPNTNILRTLDRMAIYIISALWKLSWSYCYIRLKHPNRNMTFTVTFRMSKKEYYVFIPHLIQKQEYSCHPAYIIYIYIEVSCTSQIPILVFFAENPGLWLEP